MNRTVCLAIVPALALAGFAHAQSAPKLPPPYHTPSASNGAKVIQRPDGARLQVPQGFSVEEFASGFQKPRTMLIAPGGEILLADSAPKGGVYVLTDKDKDARADAERKTLIEGLDRPYGMA